MKHMYPKRQLSDFKKIEAGFLEWCEKKRKKEFINVDKTSPISILQYLDNIGLLSYCKKAYVVTYSPIDGEKNICDVFSSMEKARDYINCFDIPGYEIEIEEYLIDSTYPVFLKNVKMFYVEMDRDGKVIAAKIADYPVKINEIHIEFGGGNMMAYILAQDRKFAIEIADKKRLELIESGEWDKN